MRFSDTLPCGMAIGSLVFLLAAVIGCQPDSPAGDERAAETEKAPQITSEASANREPHAAVAETVAANQVAVTNADGATVANAAHADAAPGDDDADFALGQYSPDEHYEAGLAKEKVGNTADAIAHYTAALELDPDHVPARRQLGALLIRLNRYVDASVLYGQLVERDPNNADAHNDWGVVLVRIGNRQEAIAQFREALRLKPDHPDAHYNLAVALLADGKTTESIQHLVEALRIHPSYTDAYFTLGRAHLQQGELDEALAQFQHVLRLDREYEGLDYQLGRTFLQQDELKKAIQHFSEAVRRKPLHFEARYSLGLALSKYGNQPAALAQFTEAVRLESESPEAHFQLASVLAELGRAEEAIVHNEAALSLRPDWPEALNNQAWLLATAESERLRNPQRALELAARAKALADHKMPRVLDTLAAAQAAAGEFDEAQQTAMKAAEWAERTDQSELAAQIKQRAKEYQSRNPHRQTSNVEPAGE